MPASPQLTPQPTPSLPLTWVHHPAREEPARLALFAFILILTVSGLAMVEPSWILAVVAAGVLVAAAAPFLFPTRYTFLAEGVRVRTLVTRKQRRWEELKRWQPDHNGILLSPFRTPSPLDDLRGLYLRKPPPQVRELLELRLGPPTPPPSRAKAPAASHPERATS